jgi:hypothetical protein
MRLSTSSNGTACDSASAGFDLEGFTVDMDKYYLALGRFIVMYADIEGSLFVTLMRAAGIELKTAQALFSGTRVGGAISFIRRLYETRNTEIPARLDEVFRHLNAITTFRDDLLHNGVKYLGTHLQSTNELKAHADRTLVVRDVSPELLDAMTDDLRVIGFYLAVRLTVADEDIPPSSLLRAPWRYTPALPSTKGQQTPRAARKQKRQRKPLQE